ncbi:MAG TPA: DUF2203 domain-containing protein [Thermoplasmataceae archaeon]|nr:DUF2203 domain-containing protein [Thermoplasmataceae archaeon]
MPAQLLFDLNKARTTLKWLKPKLDELQKLGRQLIEAMDNKDLDTADDLSKQIEGILSKIYKRGVEIKSQDLTLIDFPAVINGLPAYLCWRYGEKDVEYWHYLEDGFAGRKPLTGKEEILSPR